MSTEKVHIMIKRWTKQISVIDFVLFIGIINLKVSLDTRNKTEVLTMKITSKLAAILCAAALFMTVGCSNGGETSSGSSEPDASGPRTFPALRIPKRMKAARYQRRKLWTV